MTTEKRQRSLANLRPIPKGVALNPGGRKAVPQEVKDVLEAATPHAARQLVALMDDPSPKIRLHATQAVMDRVFGRPKQNVDVNVTDVAKVHMQALQEIEARRKARLEGRKVVEDAVVTYTEKVEENSEAEPNNTNDFSDLC